MFQQVSFILRWKNIKPICGAVHGGGWIQTPTFNETGTLALQTSIEKRKIFRDAKATGLGSKAFCLCTFFFSYHTKPSKTRAGQNEIWRSYYGELLQYLVFVIPTDDSFCFTLFFVFFASFFAMVLNIKQLKLELGRNEKPALMLNFSFAHMRVRQGGFIRLFLAVHWVWSCCRSCSKHQ